MSAGEQGEFKLGADPSEILQAYRLATNAVKEYEDRVKQMAKASKELTEEQKSEFDDTVRKLEGARKVVQLLTDDYRKLGNTAKEIKGSTKVDLIDDDFRRQAGEIDQIRAQRSVAEARARKQEMDDIHRVAEAARMGIQTEELKEAERHFEQMQHRKDERQIREALMLLTKQETAELEKQGVISSQQAKIATLHRGVLPSVGGSGGVTAGGLNALSSSGIRWREIMTQMSYATNDFLAVNGGLAERVRAVANNIQYAALMLPGPWGQVINILTLGLQLVTQMGGMFGVMTEAQKENAKATEVSAKAYAGMRDELDKLTMKEDEYQKKKLEGRLGDATETAKERLKKSQEALAEAQGGTVAGAEAQRNRVFNENKFDPSSLSGWFDMPGQAMRRLGANTNVMWQGIKRAGTGSQDTDEDIRRLQQAQADRDGAQANLQQTDRLRQQIVEESDRKNREKEAMEAIGGGKSDLMKIYERESQDKGMAAALKHLEDMIRDVLPEKLKGSAGFAANKIAEEGSSKLAGIRLSKQFDGRSDLEKQADEAKEKLERSRIDREKKEIEFNKDGFLDPKEKAFLKALENITKGLDVAYKELEEKVKAEKKGREDKLKQGPVPERPPEIKRNGNV